MLLRPLAVIVLLLVVGFAPWAQAALKVSNPVTGNYNVGTSWVGGVAPTTTDTVQIVNGANITTTSSTSVGSITVDNGGILTVSSTLTCNSSNNPSWLVNGAVNNIGGANTVALGVNATMVITNGGVYTNASSGSGTANIGAGASITFLSGSTYVNNKNGGTVPTCTFLAGSKAVFIGNTSTGPAVQTVGQAFGTVIWNCSQAAAIGNAGVFDTTILGDFIIQNTGGFEMRLGSTQTGSMNVAGNLIVTNGILNLSSSTGVQTVNVTNNVVVTSGGTITVTTAGKGIIALQKAGGIPFTMTGTNGSGVKMIIPSTSSVTVSNTETLGILDVNGILNLNGQSLTNNALTNDVVSVGYITNSGAATTLTIGIGNYSSGFSGRIAQGANVISLTKNGTGAQVLSGANSYTGNTTVNGGTLGFAQPTLATNSTVIVASGAVLLLNFTVTNTVAGFVTNGISAGAGVYNAGNSSPFISGAGSLLIASSNGPASSAGFGFTVNSVDGHILTVRFGQLLSSGGSATSISNYTAYGKGVGPLTITNAVLLNDDQSVALYLGSNAGEFFAMGVSNVLDANGSNMVGFATGYLTSMNSSSIGPTNDPSPAGEGIKISSDTYQVSASGSDIGGTDDHCHFVYDTITGDFETVVNITRLDFTDNAAKICLMARESTSSGSGSVAIGFTPLVPGFGTNRVVMLVRTNFNDSSIAFGVPPQLNSLGWLRMTRTNNTFAVYYGTNGQNWTQCGGVTNVFTNTLLIGLAVTAGTNSVTTTAGVNSFGSAGTRFGTGEVPTLSVSIVSNNLVAKWQRTPRDFAVQVTDSLSPPPSTGLVSNAPVEWAFLLLPINDTTLTGTNVFMPTPGRYMTIPLDLFTNKAMFVRLAQVEKVYPDPLDVKGGLTLSQAAGNLAVTASGSSLCTTTVDGATAMAITNATYLLCGKTNSYEFTTISTCTSVRTVLQVRNKTSGLGFIPGCDGSFSAGTYKAQVTVPISTATSNYTFVVAATPAPGYTPTAANPIILEIKIK